MQSVVAGSVLPRRRLQARWPAMTKGGSGMSGAYPPFNTSSLPAFERAICCVRHGAPPTEITRSLACNDAGGSVVEVSQFL